MDYAYLRYLVSQCLGSDFDTAQMPAGRRQFIDEIVSAVILRFGTGKGNKLYIDDACCDDVISFIADTMSDYINKHSHN